MSKHVDMAHAAHHDLDNDVSTGMTTAWAWAVAAICIGSHPKSISRLACHHSTSNQGASSGLIRFPPDNFKHSLTLFSKLFSSLS